MFLFLWNINNEKAMHTNNNFNDDEIMASEEFLYLFEFVCVLFVCICVHKCASSLKKENVHFRRFIFSGPFSYTSRNHVHCATEIGLGVTKLHCLLLLCGP